MGASGASGSWLETIRNRAKQGRRIPRASKLLICGLFQEGRVLAQDAVLLLLVVDHILLLAVDPAS